jgi:hypothetical protein
MKYFIQALVIAFVTLGLFVAINVVALFFIPETPRDQESRYFIDVQSERGVEINARVQGVQDLDTLREIMEPPGLRAHPALHFGPGAATKYYSVSLEGVRKDAGWSDDFLAGLLAESGKHTFVMGGSTTFGHGVKDSDTVVSMLNRRTTQPGQYFLNFGTQSYDSVREIQKLNSLLSMGYRPKRVIFLDGLNDITTRWRCPYRLQDCYRHLEFVGGIPSPSLRTQLLWKLPIVQLLAPRTIQAGWEDLIDGQFSPYLDSNIRPEFAIPPSSTVVERLANRLSSDYLLQLDYLEELAAAFDFELIVIIHPIGFLQQGNPFVEPEFFKDDSYLAWSNMFQYFRAALSQRASVYDCSSAITEPEVAYVDASHFSARGAAQVADCINRVLEQRRSTGQQSAD